MDVPCMLTVIFLL